MLKKNLTLIVGVSALLLGFFLTYFNFIFVFLIMFIALPLIFLFQPVKDPEAVSDERKAAAQRTNRLATIAGFLYVLGAIAAFVVKYYIIGVG